MGKKDWLAGILVCVVSFIMGCGDDSEGDACDQAAVKLRDCQIDPSIAGIDPPCSGASKCRADCINQSACGELSSLQPNTPFDACTAACSP